MPILGILLQRCPAISGLSSVDIGFVKQEPDDGLTMQ